MSQAEKVGILMDDNGAKIVKLQEDKKPNLRRVSKLKAVPAATVEPKKPKILISGPPNVGKTWVSMDFPLNYFFDIEGGATRENYQEKLKAAHGMYFGQDQGSLSFESVIEEFKALGTEEHEYRTATIDSVSKLYYEEISREAERLGDKDAFGASKKPAVGYMRRLLSWATRVDMTVILIAHSQPLWGMDAKGNRSEIGTTFDAWNKLEYELDLWLEIYKQGPNFYARVRKSRLDTFPFGESFPWSYEEFSKRYGREVIEKKSHVLELATPEQLAELKDWLDKVKLPEGQIDKWLTTAGVTSFEEMDAKKLGSLLVHIKTKIK